ncbi:Beta-myrcene/(E)-beta-ocimene synthase 2 [Forsythia ovata]|uniref:Beta-myrcene/(E)-beta-ocimene synthase 2 n=1 Tax=Forsythia ovata TaxID=205694 RepID=A0ABD1QKV3_9LAMI
MLNAEIFDRFKNEKGEFKPSLCDDAKGLLQLYEASFLSIEGESTLEMARELTIKHLDDQFHSPLVHHGLELPLHWTTQRAEARWFINIYGDRLDMNPILLELAKLNFNIVQAKYQKELKHVSRWDVNSIHQLPDYMQICYLALNNFVNEMAYDVLKEKGLIIIPYLRKAWADLCKAYLEEAKWYFNGYKPTMEEYMNNAWISIGAPVMLSHAFFAVTNPIEKEAAQYLLNYPDLIRWSAMILRLSDDLGTSSDELKRGDVPKSIQCYMNETGASEDDARKHVRFLISETWKKMNKDGGADCPFSQTFIEIAKNIGRMSQYMYQYGDGHGMSNSETKDRISTLVFEPIPLA